MNVYDMCSKYLCDTVREAVIGADINKAEEIRIRIGKNIIIKYTDSEKKLPYIINCEDINNIYGRLTQYSPYAFKEEINSGYITLEGGYRVGIAGTVVEEMGSIKNIKNISSMNIRIAREIKGCSSGVLNYIRGNTLIASPPGGGKTTFLRDLVRAWSNYGRNIVVIDERNEISGTYMGISQLDLGERTDVIVNVNKTKGFEMALRALAPDIIAADEIGGQADINTIQKALNCGVTILCTLHSGGAEDILNKKEIYTFFNNKVFDTYVFMNKNSKNNRVEKIWDKEMNTIWQGN